VHGLDRFPVDVASLAKESAQIFHWDDPITEVQAAAIHRFEGALYPSDDRRRWLLLYNDALRSPGRIRFTQAHELGHYLLHRLDRDRFECSDADMIDLAQDEVDIESQADSFASTLLMPLDDFRRQLPSAATFEALGACAIHYGVSLTAATLRWLGYTDQNAVLVVHRDGFILWAKSSKTAMRAGAFFRSKSQGAPYPISPATLAADRFVDRELTGVEADARPWFPYADAGASLREMKISADNYDFVMTLLVLPRHLSVWKPRLDTEE
jgi:Zn-dependent peptidase ImmA (M78 family)